MTQLECQRPTCGTLPSEAVKLERTIPCGIYAANDDSLPPGSGSTSTDGVRAPGRGGAVLASPVPDNSDMDIFVGGTPVNETIASLFSCDASPPPADEDSRVSIFSVIYTLIVFVVKLCRAAAFALLSIMYTLVACLVDMLRALVFTLFSLAFDIACTLVSLAFDITCTLVPCLVDLFRAAAVAFSGKAADDSSYLGIAHCGLASRREYRDTFRPWSRRSPNSKSPEKRGHRHRRSSAASRRGPGRARPQQSFPLVLLARVAD